jgi:UDP-3-O-[3-hydroxymyristoyl] glucosamine N-acyltransferase
MSVPLSMGEKLGPLAARLGGELDATLRDRTISRLVVPDEVAVADDLVVLTAARRVAEVLCSDAPVLCTPELADRIPEGRRWAHAHVMWVLTQIVREQADVSPGRARMAAVDPEADVSPSAAVGSGAVVMAKAVVGPDCQLGENSVIYGNVRLGARVTVGPLAVIGRPGFGWTHSPEGTLVRVPQLGGVELGDDVEIGPLCTVDAGTLAPTRLGPGVKLDAHVHVGHNVQLGAHTLVAGQAGFAGSAVIGERTLVGGQAGVTDHARVGPGARIAAHSGVIGDVPAGAVVAGFPAVARVRWLRGMARLLNTKARRKR